MASEYTQLVVFSLQFNGSACEYGVPIHQVQEIIRLSQITRLPQAQSYFEGIINLRGKIIPLINLKKRFKIGETNYSNDTRIIVFDIHDHKSGIIVDDVQEVIHVNQNQIEDTAGFVNGISARYIKGVAKVDKRLIIILDLDHILTGDEAQALADLSL